MLQSDRILLVEDSPTQAADLRMILESEGFLVEHASSGPAAIDRFQADSFDLVLTDIVMPGFTGYELCRRIKADPKGACVPVILLTTLTDPEDIMQGLTVGADNFIPKPYKPDHLVSRIRNALANRPVVAENAQAAIAFRLRGRTISINQDRQQILGLLISSFEEAVRRGEELRQSQAALAAAKSQIERYAKELEARVRVSEDKYRALVEGASDAILVLDARGRILEANHRSESLLGARRDEILGRRYQDYVPLSGAGAAEEDLVAILAKGSGSVNEHCVRRQDGSIIYVDLSLSAVDLGTEKVSLAIARDVTERKRAAEELAAMQDQFRQAQRMDGLGRLAGGVAHDFNNYLSVIRGCAEMMLVDSPPDSEYRGGLEEIIAAANHSADLTRQLLAFGRRQTFVVEVVDMNRSAKTMERMLRRIFPENIVVETRLSSKPACVKADAGQIEQVILNLSVNGRDAMPQGGRLLIETLLVDLDETYVRDHIGLAPGRYVRLTISDTGEGIHPDVQARIFEPFFTTKEVGKGTGLGLATVYGIVKQSMGYIWVESGPGQGASFKVYLPYVDELPVAKPAKRTDIVDGGIGSRTILLVEDQAPLRAVTRRILQRAGHRVLEAADGAAAIKLAAASGEAIDLLCTDVVMPGMTGPELHKNLALRLPDLRVLFMSGYTDAGDGDKGFLTPGTPFLQKPFAMDELMKKIQEALA